jgi:hypothetical protein
MNYKIVIDEQALANFVDWLPDTLPDETYYIQLFGRKKYLPKGTIQSGHNSLMRFVCGKNEIVNRLYRLETPIGNYKNREMDLPQECLAVYICPNPRSHEKAAKNLLKVLAERVTVKYEKYNVHQLALTELHKAVSRKWIIDFDFDNIPQEKVLTNLADYVNMDAVSILETRGGFHLLVEIGKIAAEFSKKWYQGISGLGADVVGDALVPIPGCCQGNFVPKLKRLEKTCIQT